MPQGILDDRMDGILSVPPGSGDWLAQLIEFLRKYQDGSRPARQQRSPYAPMIGVRG